MGPVRRRRAIILPVVLILIALLSLTMAGFIFFVRAEAEGINAFTDGHQARLVAESGLEEVIALLREECHNAAAWFDVPEWHHALVWAEDYERNADPVKEMGSRKDFLERDAVVTPALRYSVVAPRYDGPEDTMRFGLTPESAKLDLNHAADAQIEMLLTPLLVGLQIDNTPELIAAILDWRDEDSEMREGGAENEYYNELEPAYNAKNGPFDTVEELLLVKGITAAVLYGEDVNRNGILDENEDDGEDSFPYYDNGDGMLDYGIAPFLTVWAREADVSLDNKQRISLHIDGAAIQARLAEYYTAEGEDEYGYEDEEGEIPLSAETLAFIAGIAGNQSVIQQMGSPADLYAGGEEEEEFEFDGDPNDPNAPPSGGPPAELLSSPVTLEELPYIMDRFTVRPPDQLSQPIYGLINVNAAPIRVLMTIPGMTEEAAAAIVAGRKEVDAELLSTPAWLVITETLDAGPFKRIAPYITTKAYQFHVEVVGYADHLKIAKRLEWIIEMVGPLAQIKYHRDLTRLGLAWPLDDETVIVEGQ
ncbi:MAG: general secretion pathway protein GspK [Planctomycetes bacterium]|nr:general secretion pathway protein GspK [Planctomycetota bacterium]